MIRTRPRGRLAIGLLLAAALGFGCKGDSARPSGGAAAGSQAKGKTAAGKRPVQRRPAQKRQATPNSFFAGGMPTFVLGTKGDDEADKRIATQVGLIRGIALPNSKLVADTSVGVDKGKPGWPARPVLYGGASRNSVIAGLAMSLPFSIDNEQLRIGGQTFAGPGYRLVTVVPETDTHPEFLLYAGTGAGGIAEINAGINLSSPIVIADGFGALVYGRWERKGGKLVAKLGDRRRRIRYRSYAMNLSGLRPGAKAKVEFKFPKMVAERPDEAAVIGACMRGLVKVVHKLQIQAPVPMAIYIYPDQRSKAQLTGNGGHGHAVPSSNTLHMLATSPASAELLVTHEATHVLGYYGVGAAATPLMGEGMAVWVTDGYQGKPLAEWAKQAKHIPVATLVGHKWRAIPEQIKYPLAGLLFDVAVKRVGLDKVRDHLLGATPDDWDAACKRAGTTADVLDADLRKRLGGS